MISTHYEDVIEWAKKNPKHEKGMIVKVFASYAEDSFIGHGRVIAIRWSNYYDDYLLDIEMEDASLMMDIEARNVDRLTYSGSILRSFLKIGLVRGGKC